MFSACPPNGLRGAESSSTGAGCLISNPTAIKSCLDLGLQNNATKPRSSKTVWPSGLRRWLQAPVRKGVGSNPTAVTMPTTTTAPPTPFACARIQQTTRTRCSCGGRGRAGLPLPLARARPLLPCAESQRLRIEASGARAAAKSSSPLAQSAEQKALNHVVVGPSPTMGVCGVRPCSRCCVARVDASSAHCN